MEKIDGSRVKQLRENSNLTQLYLATAVGVTTDTISRWENKRYPTIKRDNAEKLAEALGVSLSEILEKQKAEICTSGMPEDPDNNGKTSAPHLPPTHAAFFSTAKKTKVILSIGPILLILVSLAIWKFDLLQSTDQVVTARRLLPTQALVNQPFPVLIIQEIAYRSAEPSTFMLKEILPVGTEILQSVPPPTNLDHEKNVLKWISRTTEPRLVFGYMAKITATQAENKPRLFEGTITIKSGNGKTAAITGNSSIRIGSHHWADTNQDNRIDDDEILAVYDTYDGIKGLNVDIDKIDAIWSGHGYIWHKTTENLELIP